MLTIMLYVDYNEQPIRLLRSIQIPISFSDWKVDNVQFLISENRSRNLLGLDLQEQLGVVITQLRAESVQLLENFYQDPISDYGSSWKGLVQVLGFEVCVQSVAVVIAY